MRATHPNPGPRARRLLTAAIGAALAAGAPAALAGAIIFNTGNPDTATVALGVHNEGHLNFNASAIGSDPFPWDDGFSTSNAGATGLAFKFPDGTWRDATAPGCLCEGWGVAVTTASGRVSAYASVDNGGIDGILYPVNFGATPNSATSVVGMSAAPVTITHAYGPSLAAGVFQGNVTITNNGTETLTDLVYRRAMDWDVPPTEFSEYVTHQGVVANLESNGGNVRFASDNGFAFIDPQFEAGSINAVTVNTDFVDNGPTDHGSVFDFAFGDLGAGESRSFNIFYGALPDEASALAAVAFLGVNVYSLGQSNPDYDDGGYGGYGGLTSFDDGGEGDGYGGFVSAPGNPLGTPVTFLFAFGGVGGVAPGETPESPVLPFVPAPGEFEFPAPAPRLWYDPPFADGFEYTLFGTDAYFTEVAPPPVSFGFGKVTVVIDGVEIADLDPEEVFKFADAGFTTVSKFRLMGIDPVLDVADPGLSTAFPTFLDWSGSADRLTMVAILQDTGGGSVPEPASLLLMGAGLGGWYAARRRRRTA